MKPISIAIVVALLSVCAFAVDENQQAATTAAEQWVALVDAGQYGASWDQASSSFKANITKPDWMKALDNVRTPLGNMRTRQFKSAVFKTELPNVPPGKYYIIQYRTKFANAPDTIETIVPELEKDGKWRVSGYLIKPEQ